MTGDIALDDFSRGAALARWTQEVIGEQQLAFLKSLSPTAERQDVGLPRVAPRPAVGVRAQRPARRTVLDAQEHRVCLIGHSHVALSFVRRELEAGDRQPRRAGDALDLGAGEWMLNPGSVGQPR